MSAQIVVRCLSVAGGGLQDTLGVSEEGAWISGASLRSARKLGASVKLDKVLRVEEVRQQVALVRGWKSSDILLVQGGCRLEGRPPASSPGKPFPQPNLPHQICMLCGSVSSTMR